MDALDLILARYGYTVDPEERAELTFVGWRSAGRKASADDHQLLGPFQFLPTQAGTIANRETGEILVPPSGKIDMKRALACRNSLNESHFEASQE